MEEIATRRGRSKSWIVREAVGQWLAEEERRYELTIEALADVDHGRTVQHEECWTGVPRAREAIEAAREMAN